MAKFERLEPRADDVPIFDGGIDDEDAEEGSRLPLLIFIALMVLAAFAGVVYLAYTQGVERGRADAPRIVVAQGETGTTKVKPYQQSAPAEDESQDVETAPPPPTPVSKSEPTSPVAAQTPTTQSTAATTAAPTAPAPADTTPKSTKTEATTSGQATSLPAAGKPSPPKSSTLRDVSRIATHAPTQLSTTPAAEPETTATEAPAAATLAPASVAPIAEKAKSASGSYLLQIGSYKSQEEADAAWQTFRSAHAIASGYEPNIKQVDLGEKGTWYRLRIGSFAEKDAAASFCAKLKADGATCLLAR